MYDPIPVRSTIGFAKHNCSRLKIDCPKIDVTFRMISCAYPAIDFVKSHIERVISDNRPDRGPSPSPIDDQNLLPFAQSLRPVSLQAFFREPRAWHTDTHKGLAVTVRIVSVPTLHDFIYCDGKSTLLFWDMGHLLPRYLSPLCTKNVALDTSLDSTSPSRTDRHQFAVRCT